MKYRLRVSKKNSQTLQPLKRLTKSFRWLDTGASMPSVKFIPIWSLYGFLFAHLRNLMRTIAFFFKFGAFPIFSGLICILSLILASTNSYLGPCKFSTSFANRHSSSETFIGCISVIFKKSRKIFLRATYFAETIVSVRGSVLHWTSGAARPAWESIRPKLLGGMLAKKK